MQRTVSTVQTHHRHTASFICVAARRCKEPSRLYRLTIGTPRVLYVLLLADAMKTSRLYQFTMGTLRIFLVLLLIDAKKRLGCTDSPWAHRRGNDFPKPVSDGSAGENSKRQRLLQAGVRTGVPVLKQAKDIQITSLKATSQQAPAEAAAHEFADLCGLVLADSSHSLLHGGCSRP